MKFEFECMDGSPLKMSEAKEQSATGDSVRVKSRGLLAENQRRLLLLY